MGYCGNSFSDCFVRHNVLLCDQEDFEEEYGEKKSALDVACENFTVEQILEGLSIGDIWALLAIDQKNALRVFDFTAVLIYFR